MDGKHPLRGDLGKAAICRRFLRGKLPVRGDAARLRPLVDGVQIGPDFVGKRTASGPALDEFGDVVRVFHSANMDDSSIYARWKILLWVFFPKPGMFRA